MLACLAADAVWLATQGWRVTAVDVSRAALDRGRAAADELGPQVAGRIEWICADVTDAPLASERYDLVSACYPALRKDSPKDPRAALTSLVAPGGTLFLVAHTEVDRERALAHGFDPDDYVTATDIVESLATLGQEWNVTERTAKRHVTEGRGAHHSRDAVLIAHRA